jgi:DNA-binding transcriptional LysR family regulator
MDPFSGLAAFVRPAETQSFVAAGRLLGVSASAVGKSVARLEERLGVRLFQRSTRHMRLTQEGELFYQRCRRVIDDVDEAETALSLATEAPRGRLRISVIVMGYRFLMPILPEFRRRYPDIELDLDFDDRLVDMIDDGFDAAIRLGELRDSRLTARRLGAWRAMLCASPDYLREHGVPLHPCDLEGHACIRFRNHSSGKLQPWITRTDAGEPAPRLPANMICNNIEAMLAAATNGLGIAYVPSFVAREAQAHGKLVPVLEDYVIEGGTFWMLWPQQRQILPRLRVFVDFVCERMHVDEEWTPATASPAASARARSLHR